MLMTKPFGTVGTSIVIAAPAHYLQSSTAGSQNSKRIIVGMCAGPHLSRQRRRRLSWIVVDPHRADMLVDFIFKKLLILIQSQCKYAVQD